MLVLSLLSGIILFLNLFIGEFMITKNTPTEEIIGMLIEVNDQLNKINYSDNEKFYNYLTQRKSNLIDIIDIRKSAKKQ